MEVFDGISKRWNTVGDKQYDLTSFFSEKQEVEDVIQQELFPRK